MERMEEHFFLINPVKNDRFFVTQIDPPLKGDKTSYDYYKGQLKLKVVDELKNRFGVDVSDAAMRKAIEDHNEISRIITEIGDFRKSENPNITGYEFHVINLVSQVCPHYLIKPYLEETLEELKTREPEEKFPFRAKVVLVGSEIDDPEFTKLVESCGAMERVVMLLNLANDPIIERIITPRAALTVAEYLAFDLNKNVLVILTDMTSYCEALREFSSSKGEIPGRKGFPGYLYSDLASLYERAGIIKGSKGSVTQIPILTMPGDDITHPIPDLTGYITEGQIVLDRGMDATGLYPPVSVLPSLSRLMKDGIGAGYTREDHVTLSNQLFACYAKVQDAKALASVIGEEELSQSDKQLMAFGRAFEQEFIGQGNTDRTMEQTLDLGWELLAALPRNALDRCDAETLDKYYEPAKARIEKDKR